MLHDLIADFFNNQFEQRPAHCGMPDESPFDVELHLDEHELDEAIAHQDAAALRVDLLSDQALLDLITRAGAEWAMRPATERPAVAGRISPAMDRQPAA